MFSIKSNEKINSKQFSSDDLGILLEKNENFALFDNGNLYAKNAWIEGNINATSGSFDNGILKNLKV